VQIGIRTQYNFRHGFNILNAPWIHTYGVQEVNEVIHDIVKSSDLVYITFGVECLDPAFAPGIETPVVSGLSTAKVLPILNSLRDLNLIGIDIVEVALAYDHAEITALAATTIGHDYFFVCWHKRMVLRQIVSVPSSMKNKLEMPKLN
jgi:agmatinase